MITRLALGLLVGASAALGAWYVANRQLERRLASGGADMLRELQGGGAELERRLAIAQAEMQAQLLREIDRNVRPAVRAEVEGTLRRYGITPATGARIDQALAQAERLGLLR
jgi:hypothetical protein